MDLEEEEESSTPRRESRKRLGRREPGERSLELFHMRYKWDAGVPLISRRTGLRDTTGTTHPNLSAGVMLHPAFDRRFLEALHAICILPGL